MKKYKLSTLVIIEWLDAYHPGECIWSDLEDVKEFVEDDGYKCESVGRIVHQDKHSITVASTSSRKNMTFTHLQKIPKGCIFKITPWKA